MPHILSLGRFLTGAGRMGGVVLEGALLKSSGTWHPAVEEPRELK